ncbi:hypothetical protein GCM10010347_42020 [Streptomyces cirratus]|uniref:Uncharacterized protein n=1 Tax=Streptomyces cirratus TaxID=68187 RepID=A0ABQ3EY33_9ACTN|nr:hypothetical protein [Streptomyces cirratus]GHB67520.1 hypothetical protein GCM10010347_42020 [Streptomyces cirratus]
MGLNFGSSNQVIVRNSQTQYQWGGSWYYADNNYRSYPISVPC